MRWSQVKFIPDWNPGPSILIYKTKNSKIKGIFFFPSLSLPFITNRKQPYLKEISPECLLEGLMLKLNLQYFGHVIRRVDSLEKTPMLGGIVGRRRSG